MSLCENGFGEHGSCVCGYHVWLRSSDRGEQKPEHKRLQGLCSTLKLPLSSRLNFLSTIEPSKSSKDTEERPSKFRCVDDAWALQRRKTTLLKQMSTDASCDVAEGMMRLVLFTKVLNFCGKAPWANIQFTVNEAMLKRLIASHLVLIVGKKNWSVEKASLYPIITSHEDLSTTQNVVWVTNRQQGKTSTLARFLAVLSVMSPAGGNLMCVYSTSLDRAQELTRAAKKYIYWLGSDARCKAFLGEIGLAPPVLTQDNERAYTVQSPYDTVRNTVLSRPKNPDSCRGDAPKVMLFNGLNTVCCFT